MHSIETENRPTKEIFIDIYAEYTRLFNMMGYPAEANLCHIYKNLYTYLPDWLMRATRPLHVGRIPKESWTALLKEIKDD